MATEITRRSGVGSGPDLTVGLAAALVVVAIASSFVAFSGAARLAVVLILAGSGGFLILRNPFLGVLIYLTTFLFTYPAALRGYGNLTINNMLGLLLVPLVLVGTLRDGFGWFWNSKPLRLLVVIGAIMLTAGTYYNRELPLEGRAASELRRGQDPTLFGARRFEGADIVATRDVGVKYITRFVFMCFFVFFVRTPRQHKIVVGLLVGVLLATYFNLSAEAGPFGWGRGRLRVVGAAGTALYTGTNPNKLSFYALMVFTLLWYARTRIRSAMLYPLWGVAAGIALVIIPLTASRSGFLNLTILAFLLLMQGKFGVRKLLGVGLLSTIVVVQVGYNVSVLDLVLPEPVSERLTAVAPGRLLEEGSAARGSFRRRFLTALTAAGMVQYNPLLGVGLGNYQQAREAIDPTAELGPPHNSYLWAATEGGLVSLGLFLWMFAWTIRRLHEILRDYPARYGPVDMEWLVAALRTIWVLFLVFSFFADVWIHVFFHVLMGLSLATIQLHRTYAETGRVPGTKPGMLLGDEPAR